MEKMKRGIALSDEDHRPWLETLRAAIDRWYSNGHSGIVACTALKRAYRDLPVIDQQAVQTFISGDLMNGCGKEPKHARATR